VFVIVSVAATVSTFTTPPVYQVRTQLLIEADKPNIGAFKDVIEEQASTDFYPTQYALLKSRSLARRTLESVKLWDHAEFGGPSSDPGRFNPLRSMRHALANAASFVSGLVTSAPAQQSEPGTPDETAEHAAAIDALLSRLSITPIRNSRLVDVSYESSDPALAARVLNAHARMYIEQSLEFKFLASKESSDWLGQRLAEERKKVEAAEQALQGYREQHDAVSLEDRQNIVVQKLTEVSSAVTRAKTDRITKETLFNQLIALQSDPAKLDTFPAILQNPLIQQLKSQLTDAQRQHGQLSEQLGEKHPEMAKIRAAIQASEARLQAEIAKVAQAVRNEYLTAQEQERSLTRMLEDQKHDALSLNQIEIEYGVLQRNAESTHKLYQTLLQRTNETNVAGELRTSNVRIVDAAEVPRGPVRPNHKADMMVGLLGGIVFAVALAFFFEYIDNRIKLPQDIKAHLGVPLLGFIPAIRHKSKEASPLLSSDVPSGFSEAFRSVRTNVLFSSASDETRSIVVTSTAPREGKTVVASNLAIALAQAGRRVLLIDADLRRPRVHEVFGYAQEPGLSNFLVERLNSSQVVRKSGVPGLYVMSAGKQPPNPAELLGSRRFLDFVQSLGEHFDWVIIDSPPVLAVTDAAILAHDTTGVVFVVGAEMTNRDAAQSAVAQLEKAGAHIVGAVLNGVKLDENSYYYSKYYRPEYTEYYADSKTA
jgi:succinoglycan biosynthesis transport protein ExoP